MTIPIAPGPFSFLDEAGEAAGSVAAVREERKRHGEEIAHKAAQDIISQIQQGIRPSSVLKDPEVKKLFQKAYGVTIPDTLVPRPQEDMARLLSQALQKVQPDSAQARAVTQVPSEAVAAAGEAVTVEKGAEASAKTAAGVPALEAEAGAAEARAKAAGSTFNRNVYEGATALLGSDPTFKKLAEEAATGVLDYRLRNIALYREGLSLERQQAADNVKILHDMLTESSKRYDALVTKWENDAALSGDPEAYKAANPKPNPDDVAKEYLQTWGMTPQEFQSRLHQAMSKLQAVPESGGPKATAGKPGGGQAGTAPAGDRVSQITEAATKADPERAAQYIAQHERDGSFTDLEVRAVMLRLKDSLPASQYRKLKKAYDLAKANTETTR